MESQMSDTERPVVVGACDMCRKKKIRCKPTAQGCSTCLKHGRRCHFTPIATNKKPRRPAGFRYIAQLEKRLLGLESLLVDGALNQSPVPNVSSHKQSTTSQTTLDATKPLAKSHEESIPFISEAEEQIIPYQQAETLSSNPILASEAFNYSNLNLDLSTLDSAAIDIPWTYPTPELRPTSLLALQQLPTKAIALELVQEALNKYNKFFPIFDEQDFLTEFHLKYSSCSPDDTGWWACLNVMLAIAHRLRAIRTANPTQDNFLAGGYMRNALSVVSDLNLSKRNLATVQALTGMACILQGTPNPEPAAMLVAAALRLAQAMNLHREDPNLDLTNEQIEQRRRVFWKLYILDKDISLRTGRPFGQDDDDMDVCLPTTTALESASLNLFNCRISLALLQGQVYKRLYSVRAGKQTPQQRAVEAQALHSLLSYWKSNAQLELLDDSTIADGLQLSGEVVHKLVLTLTYIHCLGRIDRHSVPVSSEQDLTSSDLCIAESRNAVRLVQAIPQEDCACVWTLLHIFFSAASILLSNLTRYPTSPNAMSDLALVEPFRRLLETLNNDPSVASTELVQMQRTCNNLTLDAKSAVWPFGARSLPIS